MGYDSEAALAVFSPLRILIEVHLFHFQSFFLHMCSLSAAKDFIRTAVHSLVLEEIQSKFEKFFQYVWHSPLVKCG